MKIKKIMKIINFIKIVLKLIKFKISSKKVMKNDDHYFSKNYKCIKCILNKIYFLYKYKIKKNFS
jgi:hypothetical protein